MSEANTTGWSISRLARELGLDRGTIRKRLEGVAGTGESAHGHKLYALRDAAEAIFRQPSTVCSDSPDFDPEQLPPKDRLDWFKSERERRLLQVQDKELIPAAEVEIEVAALVKSFIGTLDTLPDVLERDAGITGAAAEVAQRVIDAERDRLYERLSQ